MQNILEQHVFNQEMSNTMIITPYEIAYLRLSALLHITECSPLVGPVEFLLPVDSSLPWAGDQCRLMLVKGGTVGAGGIDSDSDFVKRNPFLKL